LTEPQEDPGWKVSPWALLPGGSKRALDASPSLVGGLRTLLATFSWAIVLFGVVLAFLELDDGEEPSLSLGAAVGIVVVVGLSCTLVGRMVGRLDGTSDEAVLQTYRTRFFLRLALGETAALVGFVLCFLAHSIVPYLAALPFTALGFWRAAPTGSSIDDDQAELQSQGSAVVLRPLLFEPRVRPQP
jgi:F0F1-type ATP synthase membrane subunit c/vacuolar-type H+-ATPase subunit K